MPTKSRLQLKPLDWGILIVFGLLVWWLYERSHIGLTYHWHWHQAWSLVWPWHENGLSYYAQGVLATLRVALLAIFLGGLLGFILGWMKFSQVVALRFIATAYVGLMRNIPPLVFLFIFYFFISAQLFPWLGIEQVLSQVKHPPTWILWLLGPASLWENLLAGVLALGLLAAAYVAEIVRAGLASVPRSQWEGAAALGLNAWQTYLLIIFPQAFKVILPPLANEFVSLIKESSLISLISIQELTFVGSELAQSTGFVFEIWLMVAATYWLICYPLGKGFHTLEKKAKSKWS